MGDEAVAAERRCSHDNKLEVTDDNMSASRLILLSLFAAAGAVVAICVALSEPPARSPATNRIPAPSEQNATPSFSETDLPAVKVSRTIQQPAIEHPAAVQGSPRDASPKAWPDAGYRYLLVQPSPLVDVRVRPATDRGERPPLPPQPPEDLTGPSLGQLEPPAPKIEQQVAAPAIPESGTPALGTPTGNSTIPSPPAPGSDVRKQARDDLEELRSALEQSEKQAANSNSKESGQKSDAAGKPAAEASATAQAPTPPAPAHKPKPKLTKAGEGDDHLSLDVQDADLRDVLDLISREGNLNILPSNSVKGKVSASLHDVDLQTALAAILKSTGYVTRRHGGMIYVGTAKDFQDLEQALDKVGTRIYQTNYVRAADLQALITPLLTQGVGTVSVTPSAEIGIPADNSKAGGDTFAGGDAVLVRDYESVLAQVDQVVTEIDHRPMQVAIEAMILSVKLDDQNAFGISFAALRDNSHVKVISGNPAASLSGLDTTNGGLNVAFLDSSLSVFLKALETIGDTNVIATPRITCVNKHRAEILIGSQLGYISSTVTETSTAQNVNFLEVGAQLRLRPFISSDGLIRMEVHPELSTGQVKLQGGFTLPEKDVTQVTTNVMVRDGATVIIGGLMREDLTTDATQIPLLGSLPGVGFLFRQKNEHIQRSEILVLITPHIIYDAEACAEGTAGAAGFHRRQAVYADQMSPIGKRHIARQYYRLAQQAWAGGDQGTALRFVDLAIHFDPDSRAAIDLRVDILTGNHDDEHTAVHFPEPVDAGHPVGGVQAAGGATSGAEAIPAPAGQGIQPWMLNDLQQPGGEPVAAPPQPLHPLDPGIPARRTKVERPRYFETP